MPPSTVVELTRMETPSLVISFLAGLALFASPCVAPLIPAYLATISGVRLSELQQDKKRVVQRAILSHAIIFVLGFSLVFILLGTVVGYLSSLIVGFQVWLNRIGGGLIIVLAFHMLGLIKIPLCGLGRAVSHHRVVHHSSGPLARPLAWGAHLDESHRGGLLVGLGSDSVQRPPPGADWAILQLAVE